ncbi:MAG: GNAT family protein [Spirochaetales bacterium]|nr:GNAT family protein [Spirochaetales bacterium]
MKYMKKISGERCYLSPMHSDDYVKYAEWLNDLETTKYLTLSTANITLEGEQDYVRNLSKEHNYAVIDQKTDLLVGNCGISDWDKIHGTAEVGIFLGNPEFRNRGYGTEALYLLLSYAFSFLNIKSVMLRVYEQNKQALHCYEKVGFRQAGSWRSSVEQHGKRFDTIFMDCLPADLKKPSTSSRN